MESHTVLAVVPARGGSKGIHLKNLREVGGRSLIERVGEVIKHVPEINRAVVSTDHEGIAAAAEMAGISAPFVRPASISGDRIGDFDVLIHALKETERIDGLEYEIIVMLQPTSPLRTPEQVSRTIHTLADGNWDSVWTVSETDSKSHPLKQLVIGKNGELDYYDPRGAQIVARQQLQPVYHRNGIAYAMTRECLVGQKSIKGKRNGSLLVDGTSISIDTEWDLELCSLDLEKRQGNPRTESG